MKLRQIFPISSMGQARTVARSLRATEMHLEIFEQLVRKWQKEARAFLAKDGVPESKAVEFSRMHLEHEPAIKEAAKDISKSAQNFHEEHSAAPILEGRLRDSVWNFSIGGLPFAFVGFVGSFASFGWFTGTALALGAALWARAGQISSMASRLHDLHRSLNTFFRGTTIGDAADTASGKTPITDWLSPMERRQGNALLAIASTIVRNGERPKLPGKECPSNGAEETTYTVVTDVPKFLQA